MKNRMSLFRMTSLAFLATLAAILIGRNAIPPETLPVPDTSATMQATLAVAATAPVPGVDTGPLVLGVETGGVEAVQAFEGLRVAYEGQPDLALRAAMVAEMARVAEERAEILRPLMSRDPDAFLNLALTAEQVAALPPEVRAFVERHVSGVGYFGVFCASPDPEDRDPWHPMGKGGGLGREVILDGNLYQAYVPEALSEVQSKEEVYLEGIAWEDEIVVADLPDADGADAGGEVGEASYADLPPAPKTMLYLIGRFLDETSDPITVANANARMQVVSDFYLNNSRGTVSFTALANNTPGGALMDIVYVTLPKTLAETPNYTGLATILNEAHNAALAQGYNRNDYDYYVLVTSDPPGAFPYAGRANLGSKGTHVVGNNTTLRTVGHELGHNFGLTHAYSWRTNALSPIGQDSVPGGYVSDGVLDEMIEYGHFYSLMSAQSGGNYDNANLPHFSPLEKWKIGFYGRGSGSANEIREISGSGTYRVYRHDARNLTQTPLGLRIQTPVSLYNGGTQTYRYWLGFRYVTGWGVGTSFNQTGLQVDLSASSDNYPIQLDMTPYTDNSTTYINQESLPGSYWTVDNNDKRDGALRMGHTYSDVANGIHITPVALNIAVADAEYMDVVINIGSFAGNQAPSISQFTASSLNVAVNTAVNFTVVANDPNGDTLAYGWEFDPVKDHTSSGLNTSTASKTWSTAGVYKVRVLVSDMKGGVSSRTLVVTVGSPADARQIAGTVFHNGLPLGNARVSVGSTHQAWTNSDGTYQLVGLSSASHTVVCAADGLSFTTQFTNPVDVSGGNAAAKNFSSGSAPSNTAPSVNAGADLAVTLPASANLAGTASDDGLPSGALTTTWSKQSGPGTVTFGNAAALSTTASFSVAGTYVLRLTANDGSLSATDDVTVAVQAGGGGGGTVRVENTDPSLVFVGTWTLQNNASDSGGSIHYGGSNATITHTFAGTSVKVGVRKGSSTGNCDVIVDGVVVLSNFSTKNSSGTQYQQIIYENNSLSAGTHTVTFKGRGNGAVNFDFFELGETASNTAPSVNAGSDLSVTLPASANLAGTASDDGLPSGSLTTTWSKQSGPGTVTFGNAAALSTTASFSVAGTYVLTLAANDGDLSSADDVTVTVQAASSGGTTERVENTDPSLVFVGSWTLQNNASDSGGSIHYGGNNSTISLTFSGTSIKVGVRKGSSTGNCDVIVDGVVVLSNFSTKNSSGTQYQQIIYENNSLSAGTHTVTFKGRGNGAVNFDFFEYVTAASPEAVPEGMAMARETAAMDFAYYEFDGRYPFDPEAYNPISVGSVRGIDLGVRMRDRNFAILYEGVLEIPVPGEYRFAFPPNVTLLLDGRPVSGTVGLAQGMHRAALLYVHGRGKPSLPFEVTGPSGIWLDPDSFAFHIK